MIISKTPLRISFVGGGSDLAGFYQRHPGAVISSTIDKYVYLTVNKRYDDTIRVSYSQTENISDVSEIQHNIVRETLKKLAITRGIEITSIADVPSKGTGLGSSSAFTVGLLLALNAYKEKFVSPETLSRHACEIEIELLKNPIGKQDQYACAHGGFNFIQFFPDGSVQVEPLICSKQTVDRMKSNLLLLYTGMTRSAGDILREQQELLQSDEKKFLLVKRLAEIAHSFRGQLHRGNFDALGEMLHESWRIKKQLAQKVSNPQIDEWYETGRKRGALGGKILGAGGGGFLMFYAPREKHEAIAAALPDLQPIGFDFENQGSKIIFIH